MRKNIFLLLTIIITGLTNNLKGQVSQVDLDRYWHYRYRLIHYFMSVGMGNSPTDPNNNIPGQSLPAYIRDQNDSNGMTWGDQGREMAYYIGTLATEYRLLADNSQSTNETVMELFYALHAVFRLDSIGLASFANAGGILDNNLGIGSLYPTFPGWGYLCGDDVANNLWRHLPYPPSPEARHPYHGDATYGTGKVGPIDVIQANGYSLGVIPDTDGTSVDNMIATLMGLSLAVKLLDPNITSFKDQNNVTQNFAGTYGDLQTMAKKLGQSILQYFDNWGWDGMGYPDGKRYGSGYFDQNPLGLSIPLVETASNIFYGNLSIPSATAEFLWDDLYSLCFVYGQNGQFQNAEMVSECAAMSNDGGYYGTPLGMFQAYNTSTSCIAATNIGFDLFYESVNQALYPTNNLVANGNIDICEMASIITSAPTDGPFCHISEYDANGNFNASTEDFAPNGWASNRRFISDPGLQYSGEALFEGNYNGLDYMLFFNLYYLLMEGQQKPAVIQSPSTFAIAPAGNYGGYPYIFPFDYSYNNDDGDGQKPTELNIGFSTNSNPYTVISPFYIQASCWPILVNNLSVLANTTLSDGATGSGDLILYGSQQFYIDLKPTQGNIIIQEGAVFDAVCNQTCPPCQSPYSTGYLYQTDPDLNNINGLNQREIDTNKLPTYKKTVEFDTTATFNIYPNPSKSTTNITFSLTTDGPVSIYLTSINGAIIEKLVNNESYGKGVHIISYNSSSLAAGRYFVTLITNDSKRTLSYITIK